MLSLLCFLHPQQIIRGDIYVINIGMMPGPSTAGPRLKIDTARRDDVNLLTLTLRPRCPAPLSSSMLTSVGAPLDNARIWPANFRKDFTKGFY